MAIALAGALLTSLALVSGASASKLRLQVPSVESFASDGTGYVAWQVHADTPTIEVWDTLTGHRERMTLPTGCKLGNDSELQEEEPSAGDGRFIFYCSKDTWEGVLNVHTGTTSTLPGDVSWYSLGSHYALGEAAKRVNGSNQILYNLSTGAYKRVGEEEPIDLDAAAPLKNAICASLRRAVTRDGPFDPELGGLFEYQGGVFAHEDGDHGKVRVDRCDGHSTIIRGQYANEDDEGHLPKYLNLRGGILSWDTGDAARGECGVAFDSRLETYSPSTGVRHSWRLPAPRSFREAGACGYSTHTTNTAFWLATRTYDGDPENSGPSVATVSVYAARF